MKLAGCLLVGIYGDSRAIAQSAVRLAFPECVVTAFNTLEEALKCAAATEGELLVISAPDNVSLAKAVETTDATGLRRWAVVVLGTAPAVEGVESVSPGEWSERLLTRVFKSAVAHHQLVRENARLEGDLRTLAYRISHDLRTPLGGIVSAGEVLKEVLLEKDPSSAPLTQPVFHSTDEMMKLIERVSFLLKASINRPVKVRVAMGEVMGAVVQRLEGRILRKGATVSQPEDWPEVAGVASWLETVWWNFMINALQHAGESPRIQIGWSREGGEYRFWMRDGGSGLAAEKRNALFQPFHLLHQPNSTRGFGLSIVRRLVELQGGQCGYDPVSAGGPAFFFTLPFADLAPGTPNRTKVA